MNWPYLILDLKETTTDAEVRSAYQRKVRECPPEKDAARFSEIRQAYELLKTKEARSHIKLFGLPEMPATMIDLIPEETHLRKNVPMDVWIRELNG